MAKKARRQIKSKSKSTAAKKAAVKVTRVSDPIDRNADVIDVTPSKTDQPLTKKTKTKNVNVITTSPVKATKSSALPVVSADEGMLVPTSSDPLTAYLAEIRKYPLLTPEEEFELAVRFKEKGDKTAAEKLVTSNLRFVVKVAAEYSKFGAKMIDLVQEGNVGLMHAVREFNPYKGVRLITYAVWWIKGYIREYLMKQYSLVRVGTTQAQKKLFYNLQNEQKKLEAEGEDAAIEVLAERMGVPEKDVVTMKQRLSSRDVSLDQPFDENGDTNLLSLQKDDKFESPEDTLISQEETQVLKEKIDRVLPMLNEKERYILEARLLNDEPLTLQEIGDKYGITRERARQLENRIMDKLRKAFEEAKDSK